MAPSMRSARSAASPASGLHVELVEIAPQREPKPVWVSSSSPARGVRHELATGGSRAAADARGGHHRGLAEGVPVVAATRRRRCGDRRPARARSSSTASATLPVGGEVGQPRVATGPGRRARRRRAAGQAVRPRRVRRRRRCRAGLGHASRPGPTASKRAAVGEPLASVADDPNADAERVGDRQLLDLALVDATWVSVDRATKASSCSPPRGLGDHGAQRRRAGRPSARAPARHGDRRFAREARCAHGSLARSLIRGAADGQRLDPQGGDPVTDGHALAVLAASAGVAHSEVVADGVDRRASTLGPLPMRLPSRIGSVTWPSSMR